MSGRYLLNELDEFSVGGKVTWYGFNVVNLYFNGLKEFNNRMYESCDYEKTNLLYGW